MLETLDLHRKVDKAEYKKAKAEADLKLADLQRQVKALGMPVIIVFEGWSAAGKGTLINELILPLDPRGFNVYSMQAPTRGGGVPPVPLAVLEADAHRPGGWPSSTGAGTGACSPSASRRRSRAEAAPGLRGRALLRAAADRRGGVIIKFFLHISKKEQKKRFDALRANPATAFRVNGHDLEQHRQYDRSTSPPPRTC